MRPDVVPDGVASSQLAASDRGSPRAQRRGDGSRADVVSVSDIRLEPKDETGTPSRLSVNNSSGREDWSVLEFFFKKNPDPMLFILLVPVPPSF
jgi:hypothetical protein